MNPETEQARLIPLARYVLELVNQGFVDVKASYTPEDMTKFFISDVALIVKRAKEMEAAKEKPTV